jgi:hypothetical protein
MSGDYAESIARMKAEAALRQQHQLIREAQALHQEVQEYEQAAAEALAAGDTDTANYHVELLTEKEQELAHVAERLPPMPPPDEADGKARWGLHHCGAWREVQRFQDNRTGTYSVRMNGSMITPVCWASS